MAAATSLTLVAEGDGHARTGELTLSTEPPGIRGREPLQNPGRFIVAAPH